MSAHPKGRHARTRRPANLSQPRAIPARHHPKAHLDPAKIVTNPQPIPLIRNNFVVKTLEVGLEARLEARHKYRLACPHSTCVCN